MPEEVSIYDANRLETELKKIKAGTLIHIIQQGGDQMVGFFMSYDLNALGPGKPAILITDKLKKLGKPATINYWGIDFSVIFRINMLTPEPIKVLKFGE